MADTPPIVRQVMAQQQASEKELHDLFMRMLRHEPLTSEQGYQRMLDNPEWTRRALGHGAPLSEEQKRRWAAVKPARWDDPPQERGHQGKFHKVFRMSDGTIIYQ